MSVGHEERRPASATGWWDRWRGRIVTLTLIASSASISVGLALLVQQYLSGQQQPNLLTFLLLFIGVATFAPAAGAQAAFLIEQESRDTAGRIEAGQDGDADEAHMRSRERILRDIYGQTLAQAKVSFRASMTFAAAGGGLLLVGIALAVVNTEASGTQYSAIIASVAGVIVKVISAVFFIESNRTRRQMCILGRLLDQEIREDKLLHTAERLTRQVGDHELQDRLRAALAEMMVRKPPLAEIGAADGSAAGARGARPLARTESATAAAHP